MKYQDKILKGLLIKRYKRFFADIKLDKDIVTTYCPNTGSLLGLLSENSEVLVAKVNNPKAKLKYRLEAIKSGKTFVGINTSLPNSIVFEAISKGMILKGIKGNLRQEVKYGENSRVDIFIENKKGKNSYIEVKSVTLSRTKGIAEFPDAITARGSKHLIELSKMSEKGENCYMVYLIQRDDVKKFSIAKDIDPEYYRNSILAKNHGVKFLAYKCKVNNEGINIISKIEISEN